MKVKCIYRLIVAVAVLTLLALPALAAPVAVTGGAISALGTDAMGEVRPAPDGYIACYADQQGDANYSMLFDLGSKPADTVKAILLQNTTEFTTWRVVGKVNIKVSSQEDMSGFDPANASLYDTTVLSGGTVLPTASVDPWVQDGLQAGEWRTAALTTPVAKRFFLIEVTDCPDGPISIPATSYFFLGDANYTTELPPIDINGINVTGGEICALGTDAMFETRPAPDGYIACYADQQGDAKYSMLFDLGSKPAETVKAIKLQNTDEFTTWRVIGKVNILVSSHEDEYSFDPKNASLYDTTVLSGGTVLPTGWDGLQAGEWRTAALTIPAAKRFFLIEVTDCPDGPISVPDTSYFFLGDVDYITELPPIDINGINVTGGEICALGTDAMLENRPAPDGYFGCYSDINATGDGKYTMLLDTLTKPADTVKAILLQNTTEFTTWRVVGKVNIKVSSQEDNYGFDPKNASLYDTTVLSNGTVMPTASVDPWVQDGLQAGEWRTAALTTPAANRFFLIEVTDCPDGPISATATSYFFLGDANYTTELPPIDINGINVTGGEICALGTDAMGEVRPAPDGYIACYADQQGDAKYSMLFDLGSKPAETVKAIKLQNTDEFTTWRVVGKVNVKVSSQEDMYGFDPKNASLYDTTVLSGGTVLPTATVTPWNQDGLQAGAWRTATLTTPAAKRFFLIEVTDCPDGPISVPDTSYFFLGDVDYATELPPVEIEGFNVTGGKIRGIGTDGMLENRPAPDGYFGCYSDINATGDGKYTMLLDTLTKPAEAVEGILLQNTTEFTTWWSLSKVNILVSSHEDEYGFDPTNANLYDTVVLSNGTVTPTASQEPLNQEGIEAGLWRTAALTTPVAKRFFLIEVTATAGGPISDPYWSYFFLGDVNYSTNLPPVIPPTIQAITGTITVDANLSEWNDVTWIPMDKAYDGVDATLDADIPDGFTCYAARWNESNNKIYVAVKVKDLHHKFLDEYTAWDARDAIELYLHTTAPSPVNFYSAVPPYTSAQCYATGVNTSGGTWFSMSNASAVPVHAGFQAAAKEVGEWLHYEFAMTPFDSFDIVGGNNTITNLNIGDTVGLDVLAVGHNGTSYTGTKGTHKRAGMYDNFTLFTQHPIVGPSIQVLPIVGTTNKAVLDAVMIDAAPNYVWVLWGKVTVIDSDSFTINDGSGVTIEVSAPGYADLGVGNGSYVSVRGTLDAVTKILTSQGITKQN